MCDQDVFLTNAQANEVMGDCYSGSDDEFSASNFNRYFELRISRDIIPFTHDEAMKVWCIDMSPHNLLLAKRMGVTVENWVEVSKLVDSDPDELFDYFSYRVADRDTHDQAMKRLRTRLYDEPALPSES